MNINIYVVLIKILQICSYLLHAPLIFVYTVYMIQYICQCSIKSVYTSEKMKVNEGTAMSRLRMSSSRWRCVISLSGGATSRGLTSCRRDSSSRYNSSTTRNPHSVAYGRSLIVSLVLCKNQNI